MNAIAFIQAGYLQKVKVISTVHYINKASLEGEK